MARKRKVTGSGLLSSVEEERSGGTIANSNVSSNSDSGRSDRKKTVTGSDLLSAVEQERLTSGKSTQPVSVGATSKSKKGVISKTGKSFGDTPTAGGLASKQLGLTKRSGRLSVLKQQTDGGPTSKNDLNYSRTMQDYARESREYEQAYQDYEDYLSKYSDHYSREATQKRLKSATEKREQAKADTTSESESVWDAYLKATGGISYGASKGALTSTLKKSNQPAVRELEQTITAEQSRLSALDAADEQERLLGLDLSKAKERLDAKKRQQGEQLKRYVKEHGYAGNVSYRDLDSALDDEVQQLQAEYDQAYNLQWRRDQSSKYNALSQNADYADNTGYRPELARRDTAYAAINGDQQHRQGNSGKGITLIDNEDKYDYLSEDERSTYNYLYNTQGYQAAEDYLDYLSYDLNERRQSAKYKATSDFAGKNVGTGIISSALSVPANLASGIGAIDIGIQRAANAESGRPVDFNSAWQDPYYYTNTVRSTISNNLDTKYGTLSDSIPVIGGQGLGFLYQTGMSMADSAAIAALSYSTGIPEMAGTSLLGGSAAVSSMHDAHNKGLSDGQALATGVMAGIAETLFEGVSLEKLLKPAALTGGTTATQVKNLLKQTAAQAGVEASEEFFTTAANIMTDLLINGDQSDILTTYQSYLDQGMTGAEAGARTFGDELSGALQDALAGAISGSVMGGAKMGTAMIANNLSNSDAATGRRVVQSGTVQQVLDLAQQLGTDASLYEQVSKQIQEADAEQAQQSVGDAAQPKYNVQTVGQLANAVQAQPQGEAIQSRLIALGESEDTAELADAIYKKANARKMTRQQEQLLSGSEIGQQVADELTAAIRGEQGSGWANDAVNASRSISQYQRKASSEADSAIRDAVVNRHVGLVAKSAGQVSVENGEQAATITGIRRTSKEDGGVSVIVKDENGSVSTVSLNDLTRLPASTSALIQQALHYPGNAANVMFASYTDGQTVGDYSRAWAAGWDAGINGADIPSTGYEGFSKAVQMAYETAQSMKQQEAARKDVTTGRKAYENQTERTARTADRAKAVSAKEIKSGTVSYDGGTLTSNGVEYTLPAVQRHSMTDYQKQAASAIEQLVKAGVADSVVFFASDVNSGTSLPFNGAYLNNTLYIDLNAGKFTSDDTRQIVMQTFGHELTHTLESTDAYADLKRFVLDHIGEEKLAEIRQRLEDTGLYSESDFEVETVANACAEVLFDSQAVRAMAKENRTLFERVRDFARNLIQKIRDVYKQENSFRQESILMRDVADQLAELWDAALIEKVSGNSENREQNTEFSMRDPVEETKDLLALHNLTEENLRDVLKLGGFPMPSIAVVKAEQGHSKYGPISLVLPKASIDPEADSRNHIYGADAYTPTAPAVEYPVNYDRLLDVERTLNNLAGGVANGIFSNSSLIRSLGIDDTSDMSTEQLAERLAGKDTVLAAYLADHGKTVAPILSDKVWNKYGNDLLQTLVDQIGEQRLAEINANFALGMQASESLGPDAETIRDQLREYYRKAGEASLRRVAKRNGWSQDEIEAKRQSRIDRSMENNVSMFTLEQIARDAWNMYLDKGKTKGEVDRMATLNALREQVNHSDVKEWLQGKLSGLLGEPGIYNGKERFTPSGNSRSFSQLHYAYTAENIVRAMTETQSQRGEKVFVPNSTGLMSTATPEYSSISDVKQDSGRLQTVDDQEYKELLDEIDDSIGDVITKVRQQNKPHSDNSFEENDIIGSILVSSAAGKHAPSAIIRAFAKEGYTIDKETARMVQALYHSAAQMPTGYFEAKPERVVQYNEALAIVVPDNMDSELMEQVTAAGMPVRTYAAGDEQSRLDTINSVEGAKFSVREEFDSELREWIDSTDAGDRMTSHGYFRVGTTSDALKSIGMKDGNIIWRKSKIGYIMAEHPEMTVDVLAQVPEIIEKPIVVLKSKTRSDSIVIFGNLAAANGNPVMAAIDLTPKANGRMEADFSLISSAYSRADGNLKNLLKTSEYLYLDKNRAASWLMQLRVQFPSGQPAMGSIGRITYENGSVKIDGKRFFDEKTKAEYSARDSEGRELSDGQKKYFADSVVRDEDGNLLVMYHGTPKGGFTQFRDWSYMTANRPYAKRYADHNSKNAAVYETYVNMTRPFDTRIPEIREIWENEFYGNYSRTPLQDTGLPDWTDGYDLAEFIEDNGYDYDGILLDEGADLGTNGEVVERGISYVVRSSEQIKRTDNLNPTSDPDIRYSARVYEQTDDEILSDLDTSSLRTQAEREAYFRWERRRAQYQAWQAKVDELQQQYDAVKDKNSQEAKNLASRIEHFMPQIERAMQQAEESRDKSRALQDVLFRTRTDALVKDARGALGASQQKALVELRNEASALRRRLTEMQRQSTVTTAETAQANQAEIKRMADQLTAGTSVSSKDIMYELSNLVTALMKSGTVGGETLSWNEVYQLANNVADQITSGYQLDFSQIDDRFDDIIGKTMTVPKSIRADLRALGLDVRAKNAGLQLKYTDDATSDLEDFVAQTPGVADSSDSLPAQLDTIVSTIEGYQQTALEQIDVAQETEALAQAILDGAIDVAQQHTQADRELETQQKTAERARKRVEATRQREQERAADRLERQKSRYEERLNKAKEQLAETKKALRAESARRVREKRAMMAERKNQNAARRERNKVTVLRDRVVRHAAALSRKLLQPSDTQHIPEQLRTSVAAVLDAIDLTSKKNIESDADLTQRTKAFLAAKEAYQAILKENNGEIVFDPSLLDEGGGLLDQLVKMRNVPVASMNSQQLTVVWNTLKAIEKSISTAGKTLSKAKYERISDWAERYQADTSSRKQKRSITKRHYMIDMETPLTFFSHFGEAGDATYRMLRDAQDQQQVMTDEITEAVQKVLGEKPAKTIADLQRDVKQFATEAGESLTLSADQRMEIYLLSQREQAKEHLLIGGIVQPEVRAGRKTIRRGTKTTHLTAFDLAKITGSLTEQQVKIAEAMRGIVTGKLSAWGNEASVTAYGYKKFREKNYWPIRTANEETRSDIEQAGKNGNAQSVRNYGMTKSTVPHANNGVDVSGMSATFARHAQQMITYAAWLCPMEDVSRLYNWKYYTEIPTEKGTEAGENAGEKRETKKTVTDTLKGTLDRVAGNGAASYWQTLMADIQSGINGENDSVMGSIPAKLLGNAKGAAVGANIRVVLQQPTAFFRAAAVWSVPDLMRGFSGGGFKAAAEHSPIAARKASGGFDISSSKQMSDTLYGTTSKLQKLNEALSWGAGKADEITWGYLWNCAVNKVQRKGKFAVGSDEFYAEASRQFTEMIDATQVVDGVLQRSQVMRSSSAWNKMATSFMGEPTMSFNLMMRAIDHWAYETNTGKKRAAAKNIVRGGFVLLFTAAVNGAVKSFVDAWRDDDKDKSYWQRFVAALSGVDGTEENAFGKIFNIFFGGNILGDVNPLQQLPYMKDIISILQGYDVGRMDMDAVSDLVSCAQNLLSALNGDNKRTVAYTMEQLASQLGKLAGVSAGNIGRDVWGIIRSIVLEKQDYWAEYQMEQAIYSLSYDGNRNQFFNILFRAYLNDFDAYSRIEQDMLDSGVFTSKDIRDKMTEYIGEAVADAPKDETLIEKANQGMQDRTLDGEKLPGAILSPVFSDKKGGLDAYGVFQDDTAAYEALVKEYIETGLVSEEDVNKKLWNKLSDDLEEKYKVGAVSDDEVTEAFKKYKTDDDEKADAYLAKYKVLLDNPDFDKDISTTQAAAYTENVEKAGISLDAYYEFVQFYSSTKSDKDSSGDTIEGRSKKDKVMAYINSQSLSRGQKDALFLCYYKESKLDDTPWH